MREISDVKDTPGELELKPQQPDIKIKHPEDMSLHQAEDIFKKICNSEYEPIEENDESSNVELKEPEHCKNETAEALGKLSVKEADSIWAKMFDEPEDTDVDDNEADAEDAENHSDDEATEKTESEYNEDGTRELTEEEKQYLKDKLGWSDEKLKKCTIDEEGVIHYKTDRCDLEGKTSENGVPYERRTIEINGVKIEGVFPKFDSVFDTQLDPDNLKTKAYAKECNAKLKEAVENDPELRSKFTEEQLKDIEEGRTPTGYVWHHNEEPGKMQLVKREDHDRAIGGAAHTGGNSLWGADSIDNSKKGESF